MRAREFVRENATATGEQVWRYIKGTQPPEESTPLLKDLVLRFPRYELREVPLSRLRIPPAYYPDDAEEQEERVDPYGRTLWIDYDYAGEVSAHNIDRLPIVIDPQGNIIDGNHRAWAAAELMNRDSIKAWVPVKQLNELGNAPAEYQPNRKRKRSLFHATVDGHWVDVFFDRSELNDTLHITFAVDGNYDTPEMPTKASKSIIKILSTVLNIVKRQLPEYMAKARPPALSFTAKEDNRAGLYRKYFVPVIQNILGPKWQLEEYPNMGMTVFNWRPVKKQDVAENFADGKVKGRSRPGRVRRAGASCKGSVTDLRARAKKYGGERGKMYHWCANMKSGRQKTNEDRVRTLNIGPVEIDVDQHVIDRAIDRDADPDHVDLILGRLPNLAQDLDEIELGQRIWVWSPALSLALGLKRISSRALKFSLKTLWTAGTPSDYNVARVFKL